MRTRFRPDDEDKRHVIAAWLEAVDFTHEPIPAESVAPDMEWGLVGKAPDTAQSDPFVFKVGWKPSPVSIMDLRAEVEIPDPIRDLFRLMGVSERLLFITALQRQMAANQFSAQLLIGKDDLPDPETKDGSNPPPPSSVALMSSIMVDEEGVSRKEFFAELTRVSSACAEVSLMCQELALRRTWVR